MTSRRFFQSSADSKSLWNFTLSPGWSEEHCEVLRRALIKYGCGKWKEISVHFPNKTHGQLNLQTQRLFGQQSLAEFFKLHLDPKLIKPRNDARTSAFRKNGCIVNTGDNMTAEDRRNAVAKNRPLQVPSEIWRNIHVPIVYDDICEGDSDVTKRSLLASLNRAQKIARWEELYDCLQKLRAQHEAVKMSRNRLSKKRTHSDMKETEHNKQQPIHLDEPSPKEPAKIERLSDELFR